MFVVLVFALSWGLQAYLISHGGVRAFGPTWLVALMCIPGAVAIALRWTGGAGFADAGFRLGPLRWYAVAFGIPLLLASITAAVSSLLGLRLFAPVEPAMLGTMGTAALAVLGLGVVGAVGEEIGWRGFLLPTLMASGLRAPFLVTGVVWALWHLPLIALGGFYDTDAPLLMAAVYGVGIVAIGYVLNELRVRSGSVWVPALGHAAHNFLFQFVVPALLLTAAGPNAAAWDLLTGDTGIVVAGLYVLAFVALARWPGRAGRPG